MSFNKVEEIRAWEGAYAFKLAVYEVIRTTPIQGDFALRDQLRKRRRINRQSARRGFRPVLSRDFGRLAVGAKASLAEARRHLRDAVDSGHISEGSA